MSYRSKGDVAWYAKGRKRPIAYSTVASADFFNDLAELYDGDLKLIFENIHYDHDLKKIVEKYINYGFTNVKDLC